MKQKPSLRRGALCPRPAAVRARECRQGKISALPHRGRQIAIALEAVLSLDIGLVSVAATDVLALALETKLTVYEAAYFYLAQNLNCPLVTFDERLAKQTV